MIDGDTRPVLSPAAEEAIILKSVWELIQDMLNYGLFCRFSDPAAVQLMPHRDNGLRLFNILLGDLLSAPAHGILGMKGIPASATGSQRTYLGYLRRVVDNPRFNPLQPQLVAAPLARFSAWLDEPFTVEGVWLSTLGAELDLTLTRLESIKICSNIAKHSFARLGVDVGRIRKILAQSGHAVSEEEGYLAIPDFYAWFHTNIFAYRASLVGEMLNGLIWGISDYLTPEFERAYRRRSPDPRDIAYSYDVPSEIGEGLPRTMYWDLMNAVRSGPHMPRFVAHPTLSLRY